MNADQRVAVAALDEQRQIDGQRPAGGGLDYHPPSLGERTSYERIEIGCKAVGESIGRVAEHEIEGALARPAQEPDRIRAHGPRPILEGERLDVAARRPRSRVD